MCRRVFTVEEEEYFLRIYKGRSYAEIHGLLKERFDSTVTIQQIKSYLSNHGLKTGTTGRFPKGHVPYNKGKKEPFRRHSATCFKKGHIPANHLPIGTEVVKSGYQYTKVEEPNVWIPTHRLLWERHYGPIPKGMAIIFLNQDRMDIRIENLAIVTQGELLHLNNNKLLSSDADISSSGVMIAKLDTAIRERRKGRE